MRMGGEPVEPPGNDLREPLLLASADPLARRFLAEKLGRDYRVFCGRSGREALAIAGRERFAVFVLDSELPDVTGDEACRSLRENGSEIPIFLLGRPSDPDAVPRAWLLGATETIPQPSGLGEIAESILRSSRARVAARSRRPSPAGWILGRSRSGRKGGSTHTPADAAAAGFETLLHFAKSRAVPRPRFLDRCAEALRCGGAYGTPLAVIRLSWSRPADLGDDNGSSLPAPEAALSEELDRITRPQDFYTLLAPFEMAILLNLEDEPGATSFLRGLRRRLLSAQNEGRGILRGPAPVSFVVVGTGSAGDLTVDRLLADAALNPRDLFTDPVFSGIWDGSAGRSEDRIARRKQA